MEEEGGVNMNGAVRTIDLFEMVVGTDYDGPVTVKESPVAQ